MDRAGLHTRQLSFARPLLAAAFRVHLPAGIRADLPHGLRRFRLLPVPYPGVLGQAVLAGARRLPVRLQSAGTDHLQNVPRACAGNILQVICSGTLKANWKPSGASENSLAQNSGVGNW